MKSPDITGRDKLLDTYRIIDARKLSSVCPPGEFVDATITSPPYWNLKDYGAKNQVGFGQTYNQYLDDLSSIFSGIYKITKKTGSLWIVADTMKLNGELKLLPFDLAARLKQIGWVLQDVIVWHKDKTLPWSHRGKLRNIFEYILFFSKGPRFKYFLSRVRDTSDIKEWWMRYPERYSPLGKAPTRTWKIAIPTQGSWGEDWVRHFCPLPPDLVRRIIMLTTRPGDTVLDPFAGSGVVLAQACAVRRRFIGTDLRSAYRKMFQKKVLPSVLALEKARKHGAGNEEKERRNFSSLIWKLRKTKYPHELLRLYEKKYRKTNVVAVVAVTNKTQPLAVTYLFPNDRSAPAKFLSRMRGLMLRPPLSKYGLAVKISAHSLTAGNGKSSQNGFHSIKSLNLYENGKTYRAMDRVTPKEFVTELSSRAKRGSSEFPILASNVRVTASRDMHF